MKVKHDRREASFTPSSACFRRSDALPLKPCNEGFFLTTAFVNWIKIWGSGEPWQRCCQGRRTPFRPTDSVVIKWET